MIMECEAMYTNISIDVSDSSGKKTVLCMHTKAERHPSNSSKYQTPLFLFF